ncbi:MAG: glutamyl-tRNA reductase [Polyangiaceae bacterium]|nr:glutamyl-tRNA reductase [Polyangiaceae bacterium]
MIEVVGASHRTAPIGVRERLSIPQDRLRDCLRALCACAEVQEACIISTCNRVEVYSVAPPTGSHSESRTSAAIERTIARYREHKHSDFGRCGFAHCLAGHGSDTEESSPNTRVGQCGFEPCDADNSDSLPAQLSQCLFRHSGHAAINHLFRVVSSLDSQVVGEAEILGQVKAAFEIASDAGTIGPSLGRVFERAFHVAKRVRSETHVGEGSVSVSSVAVDLARKILGNLEHRTVVLIGAGTMAESAVHHLRNAGAQLIVVNRSPERAESLAARCGGAARPSVDLAEVLEQADVVIASTGSSDYLLAPAMVKPSLEKRDGRSLLVIDIAVPRNVHPEIGQMDGVRLYDIDDLSRIALASTQDRSKEAQKAERIVSDEVSAFEAWLDSLHVTPAIVALRNQVKKVLEGELKRTLQGKLKHLGESDRKSLDGMVSAAVNKLTHHPAVRLKSASAEGKTRLVDALMELFELDSVALDRTDPPTELPPESRPDSRMESAK